LRRKRVTEACNYRSRADGQSARGLLAGSNLALRLIIRAKCRCATRARALIELIKWRTVAPGLVRSRNNAPRSAEDLSLSLSLSLSLPFRTNALRAIRFDKVPAKVSRN